VLRLHHVVVAYAMAAGHGEVGKGSECDNESCDDVVEAFGLPSMLVRFARLASWPVPYHWDAPGHANEDDHGDEHDNKHHPFHELDHPHPTDLATKTYHSVLWPVSPAFSNSGSGMTVGMGATELVATGTVPVAKA